MTMWWVLIGCQTAQIEPPAPDAALEAQFEAEEKAIAGAREEDGWGAGCVATNESACLHWAKKAKALDQDYQPFLRLSCDANGATACDRLARYLQEDGLSTPEEQQALFSKACRLGAGSGCLGLAEFQEGDAKQATLEKGCALKCVWCCKGAGLPIPQSTY